MEKQAHKNRAENVFYFAGKNENLLEKFCRSLLWSLENILSPPSQHWIMFAHNFHSNSSTSYRKNQRRKRKVLHSELCFCWTGWRNFLPGIFQDIKRTLPRAIFLIHSLALYAVFLQRNTRKKVGEKFLKFKVIFEFFLLCRRWRWKFEDECKFLAVLNKSRASPNNFPSLIFHANAGEATPVAYNSKNVRRCLNFSLIYNNSIFRHNETFTIPIHLFLYSSLQLRLNGSKFDW